MNPTEPSSGDEDALAKHADSARPILAYRSEVEARAWWEDPAPMPVEPAKWMYVAGGIVGIAVGALAARYGGQEVVSWIPLFVALSFAPLAWSNVLFRAGMSDRASKLKQECRPSHWLAVVAGVCFGAIGFALALVFPWVEDGGNPAVAVAALFLSTIIGPNLAGRWIVRKSGDG